MSVKSLNSSKIKRMLNNTSQRLNKCINVETIVLPVYYLTSCLQIQNENQSYLCNYINIFIIVLRKIERILNKASLVLELEMEMSFPRSSRLLGWWPQHLSYLRLQLKSKGFLRWLFNFFKNFFFSVNQLLHAF